MNRILICLAFLLNLTASAQPVKVLFIGNSYTAVNNLPQLFFDLSLSLGDTVSFDSYTPGGYTFQGHSTDANTIAKINSQQWDFVVLQEQSQRPSFSPSQVASQVLPYATALDSIIHANNPCTETVFYMTWGRKNGDASNCAVYPPVCTYEGMQARLRESYILMAQQNGSTVSPVGTAWKLTRDQNPTFDLYNPDESHPSLHGSYLAACTFYASIFHKSPVGSTYLASLPQAEAAMLQDMAHQTVIDSLDLWYQYGNIPAARFDWNVNGNNVQFQDQSLNATSWSWDFGDATGSVQQSPLHSYSAAGTYQVELTASTGCKSDAETKTVTVGVSSINDPSFENPSAIWYESASGYIHVTGSLYGSLRMYNVEGKMVYESQPGKLAGEYPVRFTSKGIYIVELITSKGSEKVRIAVL